jgi:hypothetical protein
MNYDNYDCRIRVSPPKAAKLLRRKNASKGSRTQRSTNVLSALRKATAIGAAMLAFTAGAQAQYIFQPDEALSKDAKTYRFQNTVNFQSNLGVIGTASTPHEFRSLLQFDLSAVPYTSSEITSATIELFASAVAAGGAGNVSFYEATGTWSETGVTWDTFPSFELTPVDTENVSTAGQWYTFDVTDSIKSWIDNPSSNNGFAILMDTPTGNVTLSGAPPVGGSTINAPRLTVVPEPAGAMLIFAGTTLCLARRRRHNAK